MKTWLNTTSHFTSVRIRTVCVFEASIQSVWMWWRLTMLYYYESKVFVRYVRNYEMLWSNLRRTTWPLWFPFFPNEVSLDRTDTPWAAFCAYLRINQELGQLDLYYSKPRSVKMKRIKIIKNSKYIDGISKPLIKNNHDLLNWHHNFDWIICPSVRANWRATGLYYCWLQSVNEF